jgi:cell division septation protein DedD
MRARRICDLILSLVLALAGCTGSQEAGKGSTTPAGGSQLKAVAEETLSEEADRPRQAAIKQELERYVDQTLVFSGKELAPRDQGLLAKLVEAAALVDELNLIQTSPKLIELRQRVREKGNAEERRLFERNHGPWCLESDDVRCNALRSQPPRIRGVYAWPEDLGEADLAKLRSEPNARELLSPYTLVRRKGSGFEAIPFAKDPELAPRLRKLSALLTVAEGFAEEPALKAFLRARARDLLSPSAFPYDESDLDWVKVKGRFEVVVGPYETSRDPHGLKARFGLYVGLEDAALGAELASYREALQVMENALAKLVGPRVYKARKLDPETSIRAVQLILAAGDARLSRGAVVSLHLPNRGKAAEQRLSKKILLVNQMRAFSSVMKERAKLVLDRELEPHVNEDASILNSMFHELCHSFGAHDALEISLPKAKGAGKTTVAAALGDLAPLMEEVKAQILSLWLTHETQKRFKLSEATLRQRMTTAFLHLLSLLQLDAERPPQQAAAVLLASLLDAKALRYDDGSGRFAIVWKGWPKALRELSKKVATLQLTGDREGAEKLIANALAKRGNGYLYAEKVDRPRLRAKELFQTAGLRGISLSYAVKDLNPPAAPPPAAKTPDAAKPAEAKKPEAKKPDAAKPAEAKKPEAKPAAKPAEAKKPEAKPAAKPADAKKPEAKPATK